MLREEILSYEGPEETWPLGSEEEMCQALGVSRPTLRQAARLLEEEQLLVVRRGINGGIFGRRPTVEAVSRIASVFLRSEKTSYEDLIGVELVIAPACARLASESPEDMRLTVYNFYRDHLGDTRPAELPLPTFLVLSTDFQRALADAVCNPAMRLIVNVLMDLARPSSRISEIYTPVERREITIERHQSVADAVYNGKGELAAQRMATHLSDILTWADGSMQRHTLERSRA